MDQYNISRQFDGRIEPFSTLDQRIVWPPFFYKGDAQLGIEKLLNDNLIAPTDPDRKIDGFVFERNEDIPHRDVCVEFAGTRLIDAVTAMCEIGGLILLIHPEYQSNQTIIKCNRQPHMEG